MSEVGRHSLLTTEWSGWLSLCMKCGGTVSSLHCEAAGCLYAWSVETQSPHYRVKRLDVYALSMETQSPHNSVKRLAVPLHELWRHSLLTTEWSGWLYLCMKCEDTVSSVKSEAAGCLYAWSVETQSPHNSVKRLAVPLHEVWRHSLLTTEWSRWLSLCMKCGGSVETQSPHYRVNRLAVPMHEVWRRSLLTTEWSGWLSLCMEYGGTVPSLQREAAGCLYAWSVEVQSPHYSVKRLAVSMREVWRPSLLTTVWSGWLSLTKRPALYSLNLSINYPSGGRTILPSANQICASLDINLIHSQLSLLTFRSVNTNNFRSGKFRSAKKGKQRMSHERWVMTRRLSRNYR